VPATEEAIALALAAAEGAEDVKATDLTLLDVADLLAIVDLFLLVTATSDRQLKAAADRIEERLRKDDRKPLRREGSAAAGWVLLDYGELVCHLFLPEQRQLYALERLWADVPHLDPHTGANVGGAAPSASQRGSGVGTTA
jgi:ribosome-associated protein